MLTNRRVFVAQVSLRCKTDAVRATLQGHRYVTQGHSDIHAKQVTASQKQCNSYTTCICSDATVDDFE